MVPFGDREPREPEPVAGHGRQARRLDLRQADFDPAMGGLGGTEHCPKCSKARLYGWKEASSILSSAGRGWMGELSQIEKGRERIELIKVRHDRYAAQMGEKIMHDETVPQPVEPEGEMRVPPI